jgi:hypothetical protein
MSIDQGVVHREMLADEFFNKRPDNRLEGFAERQ